jgi:hypothetical protein
MVTSSTRSGIIRMYLIVRNVPQVDIKDKSRAEC